MNNLLFSNPLLFLLLTAIPLLIAITVHEFAHAWTADYLGDPTPRSQGRLSLNPLRHLDPLGTLMLLLVSFGWGKPVQFDPYNLKNPKRDAALISLAGPLSNIILATVFAIILKFISTPFSPFLVPALLIYRIIFINIVLAIFNLIPIHPLDGGKILVGLLPPESAYEVDLFLKRYGIFLLFFLIFPFGGTSMVSSLILPVINFIMNLLVPGNLSI